VFCWSQNVIKVGVKFVGAKSTEGASLAVIYEEVPALATEYSNNQQNISSEFIRPAEPTEGASTKTHQQVAPTETSDQYQHSSAEKTNIGYSDEVQPSNFNHNSVAVSSLYEQQVILLGKLQASPEIQLSSALSDSTAVEVIDEEIIPKFRTPSILTTKPQVLSKQYIAL
jgi:hypothetical protein